MDQWSSLGVYKRVQPVDHLERHFTCILFDRRENGRSGGRVERVTWEAFARQGIGLLDHLGIDRAHLMGGCMGCCPVARAAVDHPDRVLSAILFWPVGGAAYRINAFQRFARHQAFVEENGLLAVVDLVRSHDKNFSADPRGGPWGQPLRDDPAFAAAYARMDVKSYLLILAGMVRCLFDRDTAPGAEPEDLMRLSLPTLVVPGADAAHATSAARYLGECIPGADYWDIPVDRQTAETVPDRLIDFLRSVTP
jgi:pimeloyl-ACP methyl ester carboxylesterase